MKFNSPEQRQKAVLLGGLYTSQTLGLAFVTTAVPVILRQSGVGLDGYQRKAGQPVNSIC
ncbi:MAG: hypothetical protein BA861_07370 [Desulfobacterales bacterium S3730MH5]|nr:MAG: hypothetical protein BA861_07370 [Desulfobacterales bacterium S3730MH5]